MAPLKQKKTAGSEASGCALMISASGDRLRFGGEPSSLALFGELDGDFGVVRTIKHKVCLTPRCHVDGHFADHQLRGQGTSPENQLSHDGSLSDGHTQVEVATVAFQLNNRFSQWLEDLSVTALMAMQVNFTTVVARGANDCVHFVMLERMSQPPPYPVLQDRAAMQLGFS